MNGLWWWALPVLLLPILWHRRTREQARAEPLATARFLPKSSPVRLRTWAWREPLLLLLRCLLLIATIALLADPVLPWRGDSVLVAPGAEPAFVERQAREAGLAAARRIDLPDRDGYGWLLRHEREFQADARLLLVGDVSMPATQPRLRHRVMVRPQARPPAAASQHVAIFSRRAQDWRRLFGALDAPQRYVFDEQPGPATTLVIWDLPQAPPADLRAPLWWVADLGAFPELQGAEQVDGLRFVDSPRGRLWSADWLPPGDVASARTMFETWQRLHVGLRPHTAPAQVPDLDPQAASRQESGALREVLSIVLLVLFGLERMATHVRRR